MKIKWLGHASFLVTSENGTKIITDPYEPILGMKYGEIKESADIVTVSHGHGDHNNSDAIQGSPRVLKEATPVEVKGIQFSGVATYHDSSGGSERGSNVIFCFEVDGVKVCHFGDLGHMLSNEQITAMGKADIIMIPVGGNFTIGAKIATDIVQKLSPAVAIPMHYQNDRCPEFPVAKVDVFLEGKTNVTRLEVTEAEFTAGKLPKASQIVVLQPAL